MEAPDDRIKDGCVLSIPESDDPRPCRRRLTRRSVVQPATVFVPQDPEAAPEEHFPLQFPAQRVDFPRFVNRYDSREMLLVVDGSCLGNGRYAYPHPPRAGCSFTYKGTGASAPLYPLLPGEGALPGEGGPRPLSGKVAFGLEERGPGGEERHNHTSNRAKLRAVIAALEFRAWDAEGWSRVVVLTDLEYVVFGATQWLPRWVARRWRTARGGGGGRRGSRVANRDLWEELQGRVDELREGGAEVSFWLVGPTHAARQGELFLEAKAAAREAARRVPTQGVPEFTKLCGLYT